MHDTRLGKDRPRLAMPAANGGPEKAPAAPAPAPASPAPPAPAPAVKQQRPISRDLREFQLLDGRPLALLRGTVTFATPEKNEPETATVVGIRNSRAVPLRISYTAFLQWWLR